MNGKIYIYGEITSSKNKKADAYGFSSLTTVMRQVNAQPEATSFDVHINSVGGEVDEGFKIYDYLKSLGKKVNTISDGVVDSIATVIFMAGEERHVGKKDDFLIHNPWGEIQGNASVMEEYAQELRDLEEKMVVFYMQFVSLEKEQIKDYLNNETYLTIDQLINYGFATHVMTDMRAVAKLTIKKEKMSEHLKKEDIEGMFDGFFAKLGSFFKGKEKALLVIDATGEVEINFPDLQDGETPYVGVTANIDGKKAEGDVLMPNGETYVFVDGILTEIKTADGGESDEIQALKEKIQQLEDEAKSSEVSYQNSVKELKSEVMKIKASISGKFIYDEKFEEKEEQPKLRTFKTK